MTYKHWIESPLICEACFTVDQYSLPIGDPALTGAYLCAECDYDAGADSER